MSTKRKAGNKLLDELEKRIKENNFYEGLQLYRTLFSRFVTKKEYEKGEKLIIDGMKVFLWNIKIKSNIIELIMKILEKVKIKIIEQ